MKRCLVTCLTLVALVTASCTAKGNESGASATTAPSASSTTAARSGPVKFGSLDSPCGKAPSGKTVSIKSDEAGKGTDKLYLGVPNERSNQVPGTANLLKEMWDTSVAFAKWCNDQGGIDGLQISLVDMDGKVSQVPAAMALGCTSVFSMVGGGWALDNQALSGQAGSDFHQCHMIDFAGFAVSTQFSDASGVVQPLPNPPHLRSTVWLQNIAKLYPDQVKKTVVVYGNLDSLKVNGAQVAAAGATVKGMSFLPSISYDAIGTPDWSVVAGQIISSGATAVSFVGQPGGMSHLSQALKDQNWPGVLFADSNEYSPDLLNDAGAAAVEGVVVRVAFHPFEEADKWPATKQYVEIMNQDGPPNATVALLGQQSWSAWLLFATSAKSCIDGGSGQLSRDCVREAASKIHDWTGGGLHPPSDPGADKGPQCSMLVTVKNGKWVRLYPKIKSSADAQDGFSCSPAVTVPGDFGTGSIDPSYKTF